MVTILRRQFESVSLRMCCDQLMDLACWLWWPGVVWLVHRNISIHFGRKFTPLETPMIRMRVLFLLLVGMGNPKLMDAKSWFTAVAGYPPPASRVELCWSSCCYFNDSKLRWSHPGDWIMDGGRTWVQTGSFLLIVLGPATVFFFLVVWYLGTSWSFLSK